MHSASLSFAVTFLPSFPEQAPRALEEARGRLDREALPDFVRHTALELLAYLTARLDDLGRDPFERIESEFTEGLLQVEAVIDFGRAVRREALKAHRRLEGLRARTAATELPLMFCAPVADALSALENRLNRLERGLYPLADFPAAFERAALEFEALLGAPAHVRELG